MLGSESSTTTQSPGVGNVWGLVDDTLSVGLAITDNVYGMVTGHPPPATNKPLVTIGVKPVITPAMLAIGAVLLYLILRRA